jgi:hypothetical protein
MYSSTWPIYKYILDLILRLIICEVYVEETQYQDLALTEVPYIHS